MAKISLVPNPTFDYPVAIPVPGSDPVKVRFTFKHRSRKDVAAWWEASKEKSDAEMVLDCVTGWELDDEFTPQNVERLCESYAGAALAILNTYAAELRGAREKN